MDYILQQQKHFDSIAEDYFNQRHTKTSLYLKKLLWNYFFKDKKEDLKKIKYVLEPMCGFGEGKNVLENNLDSLFVYEGFDYSKKIIELAKNDDPDLNVYQMNILDFDVLDKYDLIIIIGGLHHVYRHVDDILNKIYSSLKNEGVFICYEPTHNNCLSKYIRKKIYKKNPIFDFETEEDFNLSDLNKKFETVGFKQYDQIYAGLLSYITFYNPDAFPWLNKGGILLVKLLFFIDKFFFRNIIGKKFSFATLTYLKKIL